MTVENFKKEGFDEIDNSRNTIYHIIDGLFVKTSTLQNNKKSYKILAKALNKSIKALKDNPKAFYKVVKKYLEKQSYDAFIQSLNGLKFIHKNKDELIHFLNENNIATNEILNATYHH